MNERHLKLLNDLYKNTEAKSLSWEATGLEDQFSLRLKNGTIIFDLYPMSRSYGFKILNDNGLQIDELKIRMGDEEYDLSAKLYGLVLKQYQRVDETIDNILEELSRKNRSQ